MVTMRMAAVPVLAAAAMRTMERAVTKPVMTIPEMLPTAQLLQVAAQQQQHPRQRHTSAGHRPMAPVPTHSKGRGSWIHCCRCFPRFLPPPYGVHGCCATRCST